MSSHTWEYCQLTLVNVTEVRKGPIPKVGVTEGRFYDCNLMYYGAGETIHITLADSSDLTRPHSFNPFERAAAWLGIYGWEMVSIQHGNCYGGNHARDSNGLMFVNKVAYFKRPRIDGREIDEPKLI